MKQPFIVVGLVVGVAGCSDTHDHVGMWCGSVEWSWSYTYFDTVYEEPNFRVEDTCWLVGRNRQTLIGQETLQISGTDVPDGWCHYYAPEADRSLSAQSQCGFIMPAQDQGGNMFNLQQFWRLDDGFIDFDGTTLEIEADFQTATYFDGNELWGEASALYTGSRGTGLEPSIPQGGLYEARDACPLDGCWQGAFAGNVVTGPASCESILSEYSWDGVRFEVEQSGRALKVQGESIPTYPYLESCEVVAKQSGTGGEEWVYRLDESNPGNLRIEIELTVPPPEGNSTEPCQLYWQTNGGQCPL